jgi:hypothetical protein
VIVSVMVIFSREYRSLNLLHAEHREYCFEAEDQESNNNLDELNRWPTRKEVIHNVFQFA